MALAAETASPAVVVADGSSGAQSAVSWAAVIAGGVAAVAITLLLVALGTGIGLSSVSPWSSSNPSATTFTLLAAVGSSSCSGYRQAWEVTWPAGCERSGRACIQTKSSSAIPPMVSWLGRWLQS